MARNAKVQEINAASTADIAFLLLIFFLVATTMNVDTGIQRVLPPYSTEQQKPDELNERNALLVNIDMNNRIGIKGELISLADLKERAKEFILNPNDDPALPVKEITEIDLIGPYPVSKGVISLKNDRGTSYETYISVQNELTRAFNEIRDNLSMMKFGAKFLNLNEQQREAIQKAVPLKISEAEPRNIGGQ